MANHIKCPRNRQESSSQDLEHQVIVSSWKMPLLSKQTPASCQRPHKQMMENLSLVGKNAAVTKLRKLDKT